MDISSLYSSINNPYSVQSTSVSGAASFFETTGNASGSKYASGTDSASISSSAQELLQRAKNLDVFSCIFPNNNVASSNYKSLSTIQDEFMSDFNSFASSLSSIASLSGMTSADTLSIGLNGTGGLTVDSNNSSLASSTSSALNSGTTTARFAVMAARAALADAGYTLDGFSSQYSEDPVAAIENNIDELKERLLGFRTVTSGGETAYGFQREEEFEMSETTASYSAN